MPDQPNPAALWALFRATGAPLAYVLYRSAEGKIENRT